MAPKYAKYFNSDPDWEKFAAANGYTLTPDPYPVPPLDVLGDREAQAINEGEWETSHPLREVGYEARTETVTVRDGEQVEIKICRPHRVDNPDGRAKEGPLRPLPLLFVTHGGGWVQGTHVTEEAWLLWPLFEHFDFVIVSVDYRLAPEHKYPTFLNDCWDVFEQLVLSPEMRQRLGFDDQKIILAGSSAGGGIAASLSQQAHAAGIPIYGVILNVPITCDPRHFPRDGRYEYTSYDQCFGTLLGSGEIKQIWATVVPDDNDGKDPRISPLLGDVAGLPPHLIFVAGQDPLRDEGIAYSEKLRNNGVPVRVHIYPGVPHTFAEFWDLQMTQRFWNDLRTGVQAMLSSSF